MPPADRGLSRRQLLAAASQGALAAGLGAGGAIALMACERQPPGKKTARRVHLLQWSHLIKEADAELRRQAREFESQTGVTVVVETIGANDLNARFTAAIESGNGPDILQTLNNQAHLYAGGLLEVEALAEEIGGLHGGYYPIAELASRVEGRWRAVPYHIPGLAIVYRKDVFQRLGIQGFPDTWDELLAAGRKLKAAGMPIGQSLGHTYGDAPGWCYSLLWSFGGQEVAEDGRTVVIDSPETVAAVEFMTRFYREACDEGGLAWDDYANNRAFFADTIGATLNGASIYFVARMNPDQYPGLADNLEHASMPRGPAGQFNIAGSYQNSVTRYSPNKEAALDFIRFLMQKDNFERWLVICNGYSQGPGMAWESHPLWTRDPAITIFRDLPRKARTYGYAGPPNRNSSEVLAKYIVVDLFAKVVQGTETPASADALAQKELELIYGRG
ncbi:MAG: extracellular solute-binding protein [bacterium]